LAFHLQIDADPDPAYHFDVDPDLDPIFHFDTDPFNLMWSGPATLLIACCDEYQAKRFESDRSGTLFLLYSEEFFVCTSGGDANSGAGAGGDRGQGKREKAGRHSDHASSTVHEGQGWS
jgi:hypothetical protein